VFDVVDFDWTDVDLVEVARGWRAGRVARAFLLNAGRCRATVADGHVTLRRRSGAMGGAVTLSRVELAALVALLDRWRRRRTRWASWTWTRQPPHPLASDLAYYQAPGASSKAVLIARVDAGPDRDQRRREAVPGVERTVPVRTPTLVIAGYTRVARIRRRGVPSDDPRGVLVGEVFVHAAGISVRAARDAVVLQRGDARHFIEARDLPGLRALLPLLGGRGSRRRARPR